jgi:hypothetical protein
VTFLKTGASAGVRVRLGEDSVSSESLYIERAADVSLAISLAVTIVLAMLIIFKDKYSTKGSEKVKQLGGMVNVGPGV